MNFKNYGWRKGISLLIIVLSVIVIIFSIMQIDYFNQFASNEKELKQKYLKVYKLKGEGQRTIFMICISITIAFSSIIMILSTLTFVALFLEKYNGHIFLRVITWLGILSFVAVFILIAIKPINMSFRVDPEDPTSKLINVPNSNYSLSYLSIFLIISISISSGVARNNFGFLKKNIHINKYNKINKEIL